MGIITDAIRMLVPTQERALQIGGQPLTSSAIVEWLAGPSTATGLHISAEGALRINAVYACIRLISEDMASLPLITYQRLTTGKERAVAHPLYSLLHDAPNPHMTSMQFRETLQGHLLTWGNAFAEIERYDDGRIKWLWPLRPDRMERPRLAQDGRLLYLYRLPDGDTTQLTQDNLLHLRGLSSDGLWGYSPIALQRETLGLTQAALEYGSSFFGNNSIPGGYLEVKNKLSAEAASRLSASWTAAHQGLSNAHRVAVLEEGVEWKQVSVPPEDAQWMLLRGLQIQETARIFRVQPHKIMDLSNATYSNIEEQSLEYVTDTLRPWLVRWEQQINKDLLLPEERPQLFVEFNLDALLRGKTLERAQALQLWRTNGIINADEWREMENRNPLPDDKGKDFWQPANMLVVGQTPLVLPAPAAGSTGV